MSVQDNFVKALVGLTGTFAPDLLKAQLPAVAHAAHSPKTLFQDQMDIWSNFKYKERGSLLSYELLYQMAKSPTIFQVIATRSAQVQNFAVPQHDKYSMGYTLRHRKRDGKITPALQKDVDFLESFLENCGREVDYSTDSFDIFLKKITKGSLRYDQAGFEIVPARDGKPHSFFAVPGDQLRIVKNPNNKQSAKRRWLQIQYGRPVAEYDEEEMAVIIRNPDSKVEQFSYGMSELEILIHSITANLWAEEYNRKFFSQGSPGLRGILNLKGNLPEEQLQNFRLQWQAMLSGVRNAHKMPMVSVEKGVEFISTGQSNKEMEFGKWIDYLIRQIRGAYLMDPIEINYPVQAMGAQRSQNNFESSNESKIRASMDRGLRPLLKGIARAINHFLIWKFNEDLVFEFKGLNAKTALEEADIAKKRLETFWTLNEVRKENDLDDVEGGDIVLNSNYIAAKNQSEQNEMMKQQNEQAGGGALGPGQGEEDEEDFNVDPFDEEDYDFDS